MRPTSRSEPVAEPEKCRLVDRRQDNIHHHLLDDLVFDGGNAERSRPAVRFGYFDPSRRQRPIRSRMYAAVQVEQTLVHSVLVLRPHQTIHASRCRPLQVVERAPQRVRRDVVHERSQFLLRLSRCSLPYPLDRL